MPHTTHTKDFHSALRWLAAGRSSAQIVSWIMTVLVIRLLSPADFGLSAMVATVTTLIAIVAEFGFGVAIVQAKEISRDQLASISGAAIVFGALASLAIIALAPFAASYYAEPQLTVLLQVAALNFTIIALGTVPDGHLRRTNRFDQLAWSDFASTLAASVVTYGLAVQGAGVWALLIGQLLTSAVRVVMLHVLSSQFIWPSLQLGRAVQLIRFGSKVAISRIAGYFVGQSDFLIAGRLLGKEPMGQYFIAIDLAMLPLSKVMNIVNQAAVPALARIHQDDSINKRQLVICSLRQLSYVMIPCLWGMAALAPWLVPVVFGEKWNLAIFPLEVICYILPIRMLGSLMATVLISYGQAGIELRNELTSAVIFPVAFAFGAQYGIDGLAGAWCVALPLATGINFFRARAALGISMRDVLASIASPMALSLLMAIVVTATGRILGSQAASWTGLAALVLLGAAIYVAMFWLRDRAAFSSLVSIAFPRFKR